MSSLHGRGLHLITRPDQQGAEELYTDSGLVPRSLYKYKGSSVVTILRSNFQTADDLTRNFAGPLPDGDVRLHEYQRIFGRAEDKDLPDRAALSALGEAMTENVELEEEHSNIPVAYTYLGQFIAHDLTFMDDPPEGEDPKSARTPALDLDSIYATPINKGDEVDGPSGPNRMALGRTSAGRFEDLPRATCGMSVIGDKRNDDNLPLAQTHVALLKFHNAVAAMLDACEPGYDERRLKCIVRQHFQSAVLNDYLRKVIHPDTYADVMANGRSVIYPKNQSPPDKFRIPMEFAAAAFRFGHSMVRHTYANWNGQANGNLPLFWDLTFSSSRDPIKRLSDGWVNKWELLLSFKGTPLERFQRGGPILASPINTRIAHHLGQIPEVALPAPENTFSQISNNLAARTLLRGHLLRLRHAEAVIEHINKMLEDRAPPITPLTDHQLVDGEHPWVDAEFQRRFGYHHAIRGRTPLWFYILKEAGGDLGSGGNHLGPLGSRIVMETLHAAIQFSRDSIIDENQSVKWKCDERIRRDTSSFSYPDLISFSLTGQP